MTYLELIANFKAKGKIRVETPWSVFPDFQLTIKKYEECYNAIVASGKDPRESRELKTRKTHMIEWKDKWETFKIEML